MRTRLPPRVASRGVSVRTRTPSAAQRGVTQTRRRRRDSVKPKDKGPAGRSESPALLFFFRLFDHQASTLIVMSASLLLSSASQLAVSRSLSTRRVRRVNGRSALPACRGRRSVVTSAAAERVAVIGEALWVGSIRPFFLHPIVTRRRMHALSSPPHFL